MNTLQQILESREKQGSTILFSKYNEIRGFAWNNVLQGLGASEYFSFKGIPHIENVLNHINQMTTDEVKQNLTSTEIFVLLNAILFHDIGKGLSKDLHVKLKSIKTEIKEILPVQLQETAKTSIQEQPENLKTEKLENNDISHSQLSCGFIQLQWPYLKIPSIEFANWVSVVACSHSWSAPFLTPCSRCSVDCHFKDGLYKNNFLPESNDGAVRILWLSALLRVADEVDNIESRTVNPIVRKLFVEKSETIEEFRQFLSAVHFDKAGKCIRFVSLMDVDSWQKKNDVLEKCYKAMNNIDIVLEGWASILNEMNIDYKKTLIEIRTDKSKLYEIKKQNEEINENQSIIKDKQFFYLSESKEPIFIDNQTLQLVKQGMIRLSSSVIGFTLFSWESLAAEVGIEDIPLIKLAVERIRSNNMIEQGIITSFSGWKINNIINYPNNPKKENSGCISNIISTNITDLDILLCPENPESKGEKKEPTWIGGFYVPKNGSQILTPIVVIEASSGLGKTTLSLQIAKELICSEYSCFYYSLEQKPVNIFQSLIGYNYFSKSTVITEYLDIAKKFVNLENEKTPWFYFNNSDECIGKLFIPRLTPCLDECQNEDCDHNFNCKYLELENAIQWWNKISNKNQRCLFFIDSISAFSENPLSRGQLNKLFNLFRSNQITLIITLERKKHWAVKEDEVLFTEARYLADIVISLEYTPKEIYTCFQIEIQKTRYNRHILGVHSYKIKSPFHQTTGSFDSRCGFVIYPSLHFRLTNQKSKLNDSTTELQELLIQEAILPLGISDPVNKKHMIHSDSIIVISGPLGAHKFALGVNVLLSRTPDEKKKKLIISLAEERVIELKEVLLLKEVSEKWNINLNKVSDADSVNSKISSLTYGKTDSEPFITLLNLRMGNILPEEFLYIIDNYLDNNPEVDSILFSDTAQLRTRFPLLASDSLFLPSFVDIIKKRGIFTVFIDIDNNSRYNESLMSAADCRLFFEKEKEKMIFKINNVRGKKYDDKSRVIKKSVDLKYMEISDDI